MDYKYENNMSFCNQNLCFVMLINNNMFQSNIPDDVKSSREVDYGDIFLNRLFHTKVKHLQILSISHYLVSISIGVVISRLHSLKRKQEF